MTKNEAIKKGFLEEKTIVLKPSPRGANMGITDPKHYAYFQVEQGSTFFCLPRTPRGDLANVFESEDEKDYFEKTLGLELNVTKPKNYFETLQIKVTKDASLMHNGFKFDLSNVMDNLRYRVIKANPTVAPNWESRKKRMEYRWALIDSSKIEDEAESEFDDQKEFWMMMGRHDDTPKLRALLKIYFATIKSDKLITSDMSKKMLNAEVNTIFNNISSRKKLLKATLDPLFTIKEMMVQAMECKAIIKDGSDSYVYAGEERNYTFDEMANELNSAKESDAEIYFTIKAQIEKFNE